MIAICFAQATGKFEGDIMRQLKADLGKDAEMKRHMKQLMPFASARAKAAEGEAGVQALALQTTYDELALWQSQVDYVKLALGLQEITILDFEEAEIPAFLQKKDPPTPGNPMMYCFAKE